MRKAHEAAEAARKKKEAALIAKHKDEMMKRRREFEKRFKHVWTTGPAGISKFYVTAPNQASGEALIAKLLSKTIIADVKQQNINIRRDFAEEADEELRFGQMHHRDHNHRISGLTNDDRVAELIEEVAAEGIGSSKVPFDIIIVPIVNGSPDYMEWVKLQTMKKDDKLAFYNIDPEAEMHGLSNTVGEIESVADVSHATSNIVPSAGHVQLKAETGFADGEDDENSTAEQEAEERDDKEE